MLFKHGDFGIAGVTVKLHVDLAHNRGSDSVKVKDYVMVDLQNHRSRAVIQESPVLVCEFNFFKNIELQMNTVIFIVSPSR